MDEYIWVGGILLIALIFFAWRTWGSRESKAETDASYQIRFGSREYTPEQQEFIRHTVANRKPLPKEPLPIEDDVPPIIYPMDPAHPHWPLACKNCPYNEESDGRCHCV